MTRSEILARPAVQPRRAANVALWVAQVPLSAFFVMAAFPKLAGLQVEVESFAEIGLGQWLRYLTGALELAGALGLLIPRLSGLAALGLAGVMVGATIANLFALSEPMAAVATFALGAVFVLIAWFRRSEITALLSSVGLRQS